MICKNHVKCFGAGEGQLAGFILHPSELRKPERMCSIGVEFLRNPCIFPLETFI